MSMVSVVWDTIQNDSLLAYFMVFGMTNHGNGKVWQVFL